MDTFTSTLSFLFFFFSLEASSCCANMHLAESLIASMHFMPENETSGDAEKICNLSR